MKLLNHRRKIDTWDYKPKRQAYNIVVGAPTSAQNQAGYNQSFTAPIACSWTGLAPADATTVTGAVASGGPTANQYLVIKGHSSTPFFTADLYDSALKKVTALTISGALAETLTDLKDCSLVWLPTRAAWYLKSGGADKVYPLTISGTTLTVGTAIDISAEFATETNVLMTADVTTGLFFFDPTAAKFKKFTTTGLSAGSFGSALTNPAAGYSTTAGDTDEMNFVYANGVIYFVAPSKAAANVVTFQAYNVSGDTWSTKTWPGALRNYPAKQIALIADPTSNTNIFFLGANSTNTDASYFDAIVVRWTSATDLAQTYAYVNGVAMAQYIADSNLPATSLSFAYVNKTLKATFCSIANGDIGFITPAGNNQTSFNIYNIGSQWGRQTLVNHTGSGFLLGFACGVSLARSASSFSTGPLLYNAPVNIIITINGGTERWIQLVGTLPSDTLTLFKLAFSTSLKVEVVGGNRLFSAPLYTPSANILANIIT